MREQTSSEIQNDNAEHDGDELAAARAGRPGAARAYAELLTEQGQVDEALPWWEKAAEEGDAEATRTLAIVHKDRWEFEEAERWYRSAAERDGGCAFGLATLLKEAGDLAGAEEWYARGAELGSVECLTNGAVMLAGRGEWDAASARLDEACEKGDRKAFQARHIIESIQDDLERWQDALAEAERDGDAEDAYDALRDLRDPEYAGMFDAYPCTVAEAEALYARAAALGSAKALVDQAILVERDESRWPEARALAERSHELGYSGAAFVLGIWSEERGELREAERWFRAADENGGHDLACLRLGVLCKRQRRLDEAEEWLRRTGVDEENHDAFDGVQELIVDTLKEVAELRAQHESPARAERRERLPALRAAAEADGAGPEEWFAYADALDWLRRLPEAAEWYRRAGTPRALLDLGRMLYQLGGAKGTYVLPFYEPAAAEGDAEAAYDIAEIHSEAEDKRLAGIWYHRAARLGHGRAAWHVGWISEERGGDPQFAERWYVRAAESGLARPAYLAGMSMVRYKRYAEAERWLVMAWENGIVEASYYLGRALRGLGRVEEAVGWLRRAGERYGEFERERYGFSRLDPRPELAGLLVELERDEEAAGVVAEILEEYPGHLAGNRFAGILARRRGDLEVAEQHFEKIADRDGDGSVGVTLREIRELLRQVSHPHG
ncbi:sel1 repeat family protein [Streptomyces ipomoeae]|nr:sel1 repeat family protein [Streptomyces ipomoeae]TQE19301.1 sel1 repeat family protein [Streptomyces ipomoeae]TQE27883.1 sel1 repeat family protein [Streptomyces ipomoeae]